MFPKIDMSEAVLGLLLEFLGKRPFSLLGLQSSWNDTLELLVIILGEDMIERKSTHRERIARDGGGGERERMNECEKKEERKG